MSGWLTIGLVVLGLGAVAAAMLLVDSLRGDVGGRHTFARARRVLVVAGDDEARARAEAWIAEQGEARPELECVLVAEPEGQTLFEAVAEAVERARPDGIVMVRRRADLHDETSTYARLREQGFGPMDSIYVEDEVRA